MYRTLGLLMLLSPVLALTAAWLLRPPEGESRAVFFLEAFGVWAFGAYWLAKSWELQQTDADRAAAQGILRATTESTIRPAVPGKLVHIAPLDMSVEEVLSIAATETSAFDDVNGTGVAIEPTEAPLYVDVDVIDPS
jgi:hypothetical protein